ncbi:ANTAR domain-containing protein [Nocardiopsis trehalosi]|uniref:ANTAR domain-containing protein n=1 Tax=Nocardiopsis trehalosi TaxID=109329 RepID=UPI000832D99F|nr:ANTAR domain-containing protein [Nocardiopsis trehalosi]
MPYDPGGAAPGADTDPPRLVALAAPGPDVALDLDLDVEDLRRENAALRRQVTHLSSALTSRADIDRVVGMLMMLHRCDADTAWTRLVRVSNDTNTKVAVLCRAITRGEVPDDAPSALRCRSAVNVIGLPAAPRPPAPVPAE